MSSQQLHRVATELITNIAPDLQGELDVNTTSNYSKFNIPEMEYICKSECTFAGVCFEAPNILKANYSFLSKPGHRNFLETHRSLIALEQEKYVIFSTFVPSSNIHGSGLKKIVKKLSRRAK